MKENHAATSDTNLDHSDGSMSGAWQERYDAGKTGWDRGEPSPALLHWLNQDTLSSCRILVPGCGRGHEVVELASRGFEVTAIDIAMTPVRELTHRLTKSDLVAEVLRKDVLGFSSSEPFDAIYEQTSLCALEPGNWAAYETRLHRCLKPGGRIFALLMQSNRHDAPPFHCELRQIKQLFSDTRWSWSDDAFNVDHPSGMTEIATILTKRES
ncbi:methyltransferase domain-containing protein [Stieleria marina]|uniref:Mg-protoporphyrin IX methyl transferase n=1 Tax=Stieleria marina TaxID=1930275 RepID=A0A517NZY9_9BACT|nr:Mg-protoporphyrin IX methyl transferase [Planctomycetes bacterium K23_9]